MGSRVARRRGAEVCSPEQSRLRVGMLWDGALCDLCQCQEKITFPISHLSLVFMDETILIKLTIYICSCIHTHTHYKYNSHKKDHVHSFDRRQFPPLMQKTHPTSAGHSGDIALHGSIDIFQDMFKAY